MKLSKIFCSNRSQTKTSCTALPKVYGLDEGIDPNVKLEKHLTKPMSTPAQSHVPTKSKDSTI